MEYKLLLNYKLLVLSHVRSTISADGTLSQPQPSICTLLLLLCYHLFIWNAARYIPGEMPLDDKSKKKSTKHKVKKGIEGSKDGETDSKKKKSTKHKVKKGIEGSKDGETDSKKKKNKKKTSLSLRDFKYDPTQDSLGTGHFAEAYRAKISDKANGSEYEVVIKVMRKNQLLAEQSDVMQEVDIHRNLRHENICRFFGFMYDEYHITLILEYCHNKSLFDYIQENKKNRHVTRQGRRVYKLQEDEAAWFIRDIANGLRHCHENGVIHRDIKPENLLVDKHRRVKIIDFGMAKRVVNHQTVISDWLGTTDFLSPEIVNERPYKFDVDLWALGVVAFEMLTGRAPFYVEAKSNSLVDTDNATDATIDLIKIGHYNWPTDIDVSTEAKDLIDGLLEKNPDDRTPLTYLLNHTWIVKHEKDDIRETVEVS